MSKAKFAAAQAAASSSSSGSSSLSFAQGFLLGQLTLSVILFFFIKFFLFGDAPPAGTSRTPRTRLRTSSVRRTRSTPTLRPSSAPALTTEKILDKTYYNVSNHQPESLDWFNVLLAQTIAQLRADALDDGAVLSSLTRVLNGGSKPDFLDEIKITEISLGEEFPIFSNCRVIPVDEDGNALNTHNVTNTAGGRRGFDHALRDSRLQARMDVDLSDVVTLGIETKLILNYPKPFVAALPIALSVSVVRFSGTLSLSFTPSVSPQSSFPDDDPSTPPQTTPAHSPTTLQFTFLSDYRLDLSVHSLIGSRSRLQDVPKIAQLVEQRLHAWFDERCVEPRAQQIVLPSLWPRKKNVRGGDPTDGVGGGGGADDLAADNGDGINKSPQRAGSSSTRSADRARPRRASVLAPLAAAIDDADLLGTMSPRRRRTSGNAAEDESGRGSAERRRPSSSHEPSGLDGRAASAATATATATATTTQREGSGGEDKPQGQAQMRRRPNGPRAVSALMSSAAGSFLGLSSAVSTARRQDDDGGGGVEPGGAVIENGTMEELMRAGAELREAEARSRARGAAAGAQPGQQRARS